MTKSKIRIRNSEYKKIEHKSEILSVHASVKDNGRFVDYLLLFNTKTSELKFICPQNN